MAVRLEMAQLAADAMVREGLLSLKRAGITTLTVGETPGVASVKFVAQLAFTEPHTEQQFRYSVSVIDADKAVLVRADGEIVPRRPEGADNVFPFVFTIIEPLTFEAKQTGYFAVCVAVDDKPMRYVPFKVVT